MIFNWILNKRARETFLRLVFILNLFISSVHAQTTLSSVQMHTLDTVLFFPELCKEDAGTLGLLTAVYENELLINYYNPERHSDTVIFKVLNLETKEVRQYSCLIPSLSRDLNHSSRINEIALNDGYIAFTTFKSIYYFKRSGSVITQYETLENNRNDQYESIQFVGHNQLLLYRAYNFYRPDLKHYAKVKLCIYNIDCKKFSKCITPYIANIALSHIAPCHWIDARNDKVIIGQNAFYQFDTYNNDLDLIQTSTNDTEGWNAIDSNQLIKINKMAGNDPSAVMSYLHPRYLSGNSLLDGYYLVDDTTLLIRYTLGDNNPDSAIGRKFDIWRYKTGSWHKQDTLYEFKRNVYFRKDLDSVLVTKENFNYNLWFEMVQFTKDYSVVIRKSGTTYPLGITLKEYRKKEEDFALKNDQIISIAILKRKY